MSFPVARIGGVMMGYIAGVQCDTCGAFTAWNWTIGKDCAATWARKEGWKIGKHFTCPECVKKIEEAKKRK